MRLAKPSQWKAKRSEAEYVEKGAMLLVSRRGDGLRSDCLEGSRKGLHGRRDPRRHRSERGVARQQEVILDRSRASLSRLSTVPPPPLHD